MKSSLIIHVDRESMSVSTVATLESHERTRDNTPNNRVKVLSTGEELRFDDSALAQWLRSKGWKRA